MVTAGIDLDVRGGVSLETRRRNFNGVGTEVELRYRETAFTIGDDGSFFLRLIVSDSNSRAGDNAVRSRDCSNNTSCVGCLSPAR